MAHPKNDQKTAEEIRQRAKQSTLRSERAARPRFWPVYGRRDPRGTRRFAADRKAIHVALEQVSGDVQADRQRESAGQNVAQSEHDPR